MAAVELTAQQGIALVKQFDSTALCLKSWIVSYLMKDLTVSYHATVSRITELSFRSGFEALYN